jgi:hypothetical protein
MVVDLALPEPAHSATLQLPRATATAAQVFSVAELGNRPARKQKIGNHEVTTRMPFAAGFLEASRYEYRAWVAFFREWLELAGREKVRRTLMKNTDVIRLRFGQTRP